MHGTGSAFARGKTGAFSSKGCCGRGRGTLSEMVGPKGLAIDRLSRRIGFLHSARLQLEVLDPEILIMLDAFARGVTEGSTLGCRRAGHEFAILRARPSPYFAADVVAIAKIQSFAVPSNWDLELARLQILKRDGPDALAALDPAYPQWLPVSEPPGAPAGPAVDRLAADMKELASVVGYGGGSNNWVLAPSRTASGRPILANDPHLTSSLPPHWYLAHVRTPQWAVAGATLVGAPAFPAGHNDVAAWGLTAGLVDNTDLFIEELGPDGSSVREGDRFIQCQVRKEIIRVKGGPDVVEQVIVTPRGPVVGPELDRDAGSISMRATWLDQRPIEGY